jgi:hypothetical protein
MYMNSSMGSQGRALRRTSLALACLVGLTGCYRTTELATPVPAPGTRIVAELTPTGAERMEDLIGAEAVAVEGRVAETRPEGWELSLLRVDHRGTLGVQWSGEHVVFPTEALRGVRERRLDPVRTGAFTAALGAVLFVLARNFFGFTIDGDTPPRDPDPVE